MLGRASFRDCIAGQLEKKRFGPKRTKEVLERFEGLADWHAKQGVADPEAAALYDVLAEFDAKKREKLRRINLALVRRGEFKDRFEAFNRNRGIIREGVRDATGADVVKSFMQHDPRSGSAQSYDIQKDAIRGLLWKTGADVIEKFGKGVFGRQRGKAHEGAILSELFGEDSGNLAAKEIAAGYRAITEMIPDLVNQAGGSMKKRKDFILPQNQSGYKLRAAGLDAWRGDMKRMLDFDRMRWPDGSPIEAKDVDRVLEDVWRTIVTGGKHKIDPVSFSGRGAAVGNMLEQHRFLVFKDKAAWAEMHDKYGEGNLFDVMVGHVDQMSHIVALTRVFGDNPKAMYATLRNMALKEAADMDVKETGGTRARSQSSLVEGQLKQVDELFDVTTRQNAMDADSIIGATVTTTANLLTSAQLGSAAIPAIFGDFSTSASVRMLNGMNPMVNLGEYLKHFVGSKDAERIALQTGHVADEFISSTYAAQRFTGITTLGPAWSRRLTDVTLRASGLNGHTAAIRAANALESMGMMARSIEDKTAFGDLEYRGMLERYGISEKDWVDIAKTPLEAKSSGAKFLNPTALYDAGRLDLYEKVQGMILAEGRNMVPEATAEAMVKLRGTSRPDTLMGAVLYSFSMYKNFPITMTALYGRLAMANPNKTSRVAFIAGLGATMTLAGAMSLQLREIAKGKDPLPMLDREGRPDMKFLGKAALAGGAMSIWGDFLTAGVNRFGGGPEETVAGPLVSFSGDVANVALGDIFKWGDLADQTAKDVKTPTRLAQFAARYTPGSSLWWARTVLQRNVFDHLEELADPKVYAKRRAREKKQLRDNGNRAYWPAGSALPERMPQFSEPRG